MDGMLSQDEINALLNGMDLSGDEAPDLSDMQAEMEAAAAAAPPKEAFLTGTEAVDDAAAMLSDVEPPSIIYTWPLPSFMQMPSP